jgi:nitronate monooxygenase
MSDGGHIAAARALGADLAYMGTRFIATRESLASDGYKQMILKAEASDVLYTPAISGVSGNFLTPSLVAAGLDPQQLPAAGQMDMGKERAWKNIWSAGQGVGSIGDIPTVAALADRLAAEFDAARSRLVW